MKKQKMEKITIEIRASSLEMLKIAAEELNLNFGTSDTAESLTEEIVEDWCDESDELGKLQSKLNRKPPVKISKSEKRKLISKFYGIDPSHLK